MTSYVFFLPELVERILINLDMRELLLAQRVSRRWNDIILSSPTLQNKLFFTPARICPQSQENLAVEINPLLLEIFPPFMGNLITLDYGKVDDNEHGTRLVQRLPHSANGIENLLQQDWYWLEDRREAILRPDASWRRMFPSHPPPRLGELDIQLPGCSCGSEELDGRISEKHQSFHQDTGPRMDHVYHR
ncbi:hypothetical protein N7457_003504 [Penicillium paradoxum]|uniref:uncharacterized protein n=1 Tax=Penicillium paradoxum TaxID=176176 RepID=UPI0025473FA2|nr:uncharacterized protein N7457_003504 [Penicillium paradoxum]KAJ5788514.1 hypothetical protein N7457_003504 [Penicillium paradoxum]